MYIFACTSGLDCSGYFNSYGGLGKKKFENSPVLYSIENDMELKEVKG